MVTLRDVADRAGFSFITVSRVLNCPEKVSLKTQEKVRKAMRELDYSINPVAKALALNKTQVICVYIPWHIKIEEFYTMKLISGISQICSNNLYSFLIIRNFDTDVSCDGYIISGVNEDELSRIKDYAEAKNRKIVVFGVTDLDADYIDTDNYGSAKEISAYLLNMGHKELKMISIGDQKNSRFVKERERGYLDALGIKDTNSIFYAENNMESAYQASLDILETQGGSAFFCATDIIALGLIRACHELGKSVPEDVSVAGFDGFGYQNMAIPHITTMKQPVFNIGKALTEVLLARIKGEGDKRLVRQTERSVFCLGNSVRTVER